MLHIVICDDEPAFSSELQTLLNRYGREIGEEMRFSVFENGLELIENYAPDIDLIFLDIQMDCMNGLETAEQIRKTDVNVSIFFLTSMVQYALEGYKYNAANYLIKPLAYARLKNEMDKWIKSVKTDDNPFIVVDNDSGKYKIFLSNLKYAETYNRNIMLHTENENLICYKKMKDLEEILSKNNFVRCHSGYIVNLFFIKRVEKLEIELISGDIVPISQPKRKMVMEKLANYWGNML